MTTNDIELVRSAWDAFSRGDVTAAPAVLDPDVRAVAIGRRGDGPLPASVVELVLLAPIGQANGTF